MDEGAGQVGAEGPGDAVVAGMCVSGCVVGGVWVLVVCCWWWCVGCGLLVGDVLAVCYWLLLLVVGR